MPHTTKRRSHQDADAPEWHGYTQSAGVSRQPDHINHDDAVLTPDKRRQRGERQPHTEQTCHAPNGRHTQHRDGCKTKYIIKFCLVNLFIYWHFVKVVQCIKSLNYGQIPMFF